MLLREQNNVSNEITFDTAFNYNKLSKAILAWQKSAYFE